MDMKKEDQTVWGWGQLFSEMDSFLRAAYRGLEGCEPQFAEYVIERLGLIVQVLSSILMPLENQQEDDAVAELRTSLVGIFSCCRSLGVLWRSYIDEMDSDLVEGELEMERFQVPRVIDGRGRPRAVVTQEQLEYLRSLNFSWSHIAELLGVSRMTI